MADAATCPRVTRHDTGQVRPLCRPAVSSCDVGTAWDGMAEVIRIAGHRSSGLAPVVALVRLPDLGWEAEP